MLFLSAGRALHLANAFESKCKFVLRTGNAVRAFEADPVAALQDSLAALPPDKMLGPTLRDLGDRLAHSTSWNVDVLDAARAARNFIAHEGSNVGDIHAVHARQILGHAARLRAAVSDLAHGDNIGSRGRRFKSCRPDQHFCRSEATSIKTIGVAFSFGGRNVVVNARSHRLAGHVSAGLAPPTWS
ncbi:hypothetical protein ACFWJ4_23710 [Kitasatospora sp. NPDC127067]|uniref:hypothetical protein n=1 Tax=Kitasatospora sp. NPDC127067 TaxID=3347126 RepID=UPI00364839A4